MKHILKLAGTAVAIVFMAACATLQVTTDYDHSKDFSSLKTYALHANATTNQTVSTLNSDRIMNAVRAALNAKGYAETAENPDFLVNVNTVIKNKQSVTANTDVMGMGPYGYGGVYRPYGYWGGGMVTANTTFDVQDYKDGSLIIDMIDIKTQKMFWEGVGNQEIDGQVSNPDQRIGDAVNKILATFPNAGLQPAVKK